MPSPHRRANSARRAASPPHAGRRRPAPRLRPSRDLSSSPSPCGKPSPTPAPVPLFVRPGHGPRLSITRQPLEASRRWPTPATATLRRGPAPRSAGGRRHRYGRRSQADSCSRRLWRGSAGCGWRVPPGEAGGDGQNGLNVVAVRLRCAVRVNLGGCAREKRLVRWV
jgi:hypothetical protein